MTPFHTSAVNDRDWQIAIIAVAVSLVIAYVFITSIFPSIRNFFVLMMEKKNILGQLKSKPKASQDEIAYNFQINEEFSDSLHQNKRKADSTVKQRKLLKSLEKPPPSEQVKLPAPIPIPERQVNASKKETSEKSAVKVLKEKNMKYNNRRVQENIHRNHVEQPIECAPLSMPTSNASVVRAEQDREYEECLRQDLERQQREKEREERLAHRRQAIAASVPEEPTKNVEGSVVLCFRIKDPLTAMTATTKTPNLKTVKRRFLRSHTVQQLLDYLESLELRPLLTPLQIAYGHPPRTFLQHATDGQERQDINQQTLEEVGLSQDSVVWVIFPQD